MVHFFKTTASSERVGMALDKLPDPLPLRHGNNGVAEPFAGNGICTSFDILETDFTLYLSLFRGALY